MSKKLLDHFQSKQLSIEERITSGKKLRNKFPRIKQGKYKPAVNRLDPVLILEEQAKTRLPDRFIQAGMISGRTGVTVFFVNKYLDLFLGAGPY